MVRSRTFWFHPVPQLRRLAQFAAVRFSVEVRFRSLRISPRSCRIMRGARPVRGSQAHDFSSMFCSGFRVLSVPLIARGVPLARHASPEASTPPQTFGTWWTVSVPRSRTSSSARTCGGPGAKPLWIGGVVLLREESHSGGLRPRVTLHV